MPGTAPAGWQAPRTNWATTDAVGTADLDRIEGDVSAIETGGRTVDPTQVPTGNAGTLENFFDWLTNRMAVAGGTGEWYGTPGTTLENLCRLLSGTGDPGPQSLSAPVAAPASAPTVALQAGGVTGSGYQWAAYWITGTIDGTGTAHRNGVTLLGPATTAQNLSSQEAVATAPASPPAQAIGWGLCRTKSGGGAFYIVAEATLASYGGAWPQITDNTPDSGLATAAPSANTTGTSLAVGGQLASGGAAALGAQVTIRNNSAIANGLHFYDTYIGGRNWAIGSGVGGLGGFGIYDLTASVTRLFCDSSGTTTISGPVTLPANQNLTLGGAADPTRLYSDGTSVLHILTPGSADTTYDGGGNWGFPAKVQVGSTAPLLILNPTNSATQPSPNVPWMRISGGTGHGLAINSGATDGTLFLNGDVAAPVATKYNTLDDGTGNASFAGTLTGPSTTDTLLSAQGTHATYLNYYGGTGGVVIGNGASGLSGTALHADGSVVFGGQITSTLATGAPLSVASTTMVANLNADLLHGEAPGTGANQIVQRDAYGNIPGHVEDATVFSPSRFTTAPGTWSTANTTDTTVWTGTLTYTESLCYLQTEFYLLNNNGGATSSGYVTINGITGATHTTTSSVYVMFTDTLDLGASATSFSAGVHIWTSNAADVAYAKELDLFAPRRYALAGGAYGGGPY